MVLAQMQGRLRIDEKIVKGKEKNNTLHLYNTAFKALLYTLCHVGRKGSIDHITKIITKLGGGGGQQRFHSWPRLYLLPRHGAWKGTWAPTLSLFRGSR